MSSSAGNAAPSSTATAGNRRIVATVLVFALALVVGVAIAQAGKGVTQIFGENGSGDGQLSNPRDVAVNQAGGGDSGAHDGYTYVADEDNNRITVFDADENFAFAFGSGVAGGSGFQICTSGCVAGDAADEGKGGFDDPQGVDIDQATGRVFVRDRDNRRVQVFSESGGFLFMFGGDVNATEVATGPEVCTQASGDTCKVGESGTDPGFFGTTSAASTGIAFNPADGHLIVADPGGTANRRVQEFDVDNVAFDGTPTDVFGSNGSGDGQFGSSQPVHVAVDSAGFVYASDTNTQLECYDTNLDAFCVAPVTDFPSSTATTALEVDPATDNLLAARGGQIEELDTSTLPGAAPSNTNDPHAVSSGLTPVGLGANTADSTYLFSTIGQDQIFILDTTVAPVAAIDPITVFDAHSATFTGGVDPNGSPTEYRFEYVDDAEHTANGFTNAAKVPVPDEQIGNGDSPVAVEQDVIHLDASTTYHVQLVAEQTYGPSDATDVDTFTTDGAAPAVSNAAATVTAPDEATLRATIHPENESTDYHFNWGTDDSYGNSTPIETIPAGTDPVAVEADLAGLTPGQTYHFQIVAENNTGETLGPDRTFTPTAPQPPTAGRAYELVSPLPTGGVPVYASLAQVAAGEDGDRVFFKDSQPFPGTAVPFAPDLHASPGTYAFTYVSSRGSAGWETDDVGLDYNPPGRVALGPGASYDGSRFVSGVRGPLDPDDQNGTLESGGDIYQYRPDGSIVWISRDPRIPQGTPQTDATPAYTAERRLAAAAMSVDGRTVVFYSERQLADDDTTPGTARRLYKWIDGELNFIGKRPDGSVPAGGTSIGTSSGAGVGGGGNNSARRGAVSRDGSRVVFSALRIDGSDGLGLYVQTDGAATVEATRETGVAPLPANQPFEGGTFYRGASSDATRVFFSSSSRLTPDSGGQATSGGDADLYVYDLDADKVRDITPRLDGIDDPTVDPAAADRAAVQGVAANSEDGRRVYFVAKAAYPGAAPSPTGATPVAGGRNLYLAELDGIDDPIELKFIANLGAGDDGVWTHAWGNDKTSYSSPDGSVLGFGSSQVLTGDPLGGTEQLFVYDADAHSLDCASCPSTGVPAGDVNPELTQSPAAPQSGDYWQHELADKRWVSSGGSVFFYTAHPLVAEDVNGTDDAYEYRDGQLRLISTGRDINPSRLENASRDGSTVFFITGEALDPRDDEPGVPKLYAARVGGGFPAPSAPAAPCEGAECRGDQASAPDADEPATSRLRDRAAVVPRRCRALARRAARVNRRSRQLARSVRRLRRRAVRSDDRERSVRMRRAARKRVRRARTLKRRSVVLRRRATSCRRGSR